MNSFDDVATTARTSGKDMETPRIVTETYPPRSFRWAPSAIVFLLFLLLVCIVQRTANAPAAAFGGFPDESAHYIGGLAMHDYMTTAPGKSPFTFLRDYHVYLPFFAIGVWPPFFYFLEGLWMALFGIQRASALWMIAVSAAGLATLLFWMVRKKCGAWTAAAAGLFFLLIPIVQWSACLVMADLTCSLFALASLVFFARFVEKGRWQDSVLFGLLAGIALLTKNSTYFIVVVPPIVIAASRRWDLLRNRALWLAPAIVAAIYVPWLVVSRPFLWLGHGLELPGFWDIQRDYVAVLWQEMSLIFPVGIAGGLFLAFSKRRMSTLAMCMLAVIPAVSVGIFIARVPVQGRLLMVSYCALLFLATELATTLLRPSRAAVAMLAALLVFGSLHWMKFVRPPANDLHAGVAYIEAHDGEHPGAVLVPSGSEGPWIAEFAAAERPRLRRILLRPTKLLGTEDWNGLNWDPYYKSVEELAAFFERMPVRYCILPDRPEHSARALDASIGLRTYPHDALLEALMASHPEQWRLRLEHTTASGGSYRIFENARWTPAAAQVVYAAASQTWIKSLP